jgi:hypothetical protein
MENELENNEPVELKPPEETPPSDEMETLSEETESPSAETETAPVEMKPPPGETPSPAAPADASSGKTMVMITIDKTGGIVGVQRGDFDPQLFQVKDLEAALKSVPAFLSLAQKRWQLHPTYPKAAAPPPPPVSQTAKPASTAAPAKPAGPKTVTNKAGETQNSLF